MVARITDVVQRAKEKLGDKPTGEVLDKVLAENFRASSSTPICASDCSRKPLERNMSYLPHRHARAGWSPRQAGFYWGTTGHTPEPVAIGAIGPGESAFRGYMDNTDFARALHKLIGAR